MKGFAQISQPLGIIFILCVISINIQAQSRAEVDLAREYLRKKEYKKAVSLYEKIYSKQPSSSVYFRYYVRALVGKGEYKKAEKISKRFIRRYKNDLIAHIELGQVYMQQGEQDKANDVYEGIIEQVKGDRSKMRRLANLFIGRRQFGWAEKVYLAGAKRVKGYQFNYELANIYYYQRAYVKMIDAYLELLAVNDRYLGTVKSRLNSAVYSDTDDTLTSILKDRLLIKSQEYSGRDVFNELLIWAYSHDKEYNMALVQAKALDRRNKENGARIIKIARKALKANKYGVVADAASFVMEKDRRSPYYLIARQLYLHSQYKQVEKGILYNEADLVKLVSEYKAAIKDSRQNPKLLPFYIDLANLYAFFLHNPDSALFALSNADKLPGLSALDHADIDILRADVKLAKGDIFDATLIYAGVERKFKNNPVGYKAKLRKALMAFYQCDFDWAQGQVDILKASTSKLIANDASELSLIISENKSEDTLQRPLCTYAKAAMAIHQNKNTEALQKLDSLIINFPGQPIIDEALMKKAKLLKTMGKYEEANTVFLRVANNFSYEPYAAEALFNAGQLYHDHLYKPNEAFELFKKILTDYPLSIYNPPARKRLRSIRKNLVN